jgi:P-type Mg2+ transporter
MTAPDTGDSWAHLTLADASRLDSAAVLDRLESSERGLTSAQAQLRLNVAGPNAVRSHAVRPFEVLVRQFRNPLLILLAATATLSIALGEHTDAAIILVIVTMSVTLGFINEYRSERATEALHSRIHHRAVAMRDGKPAEVDFTDLVPGDVIQLEVGDIVPADARVLETHGLECDEAILTGESAPAEKSAGPVLRAAAPLELPSCLFMGTVVTSGGGRAVIVGTGSRTAFGAIALGLGERHPMTAFQLGLRDYSILLVRVTVVVSAAVFAVNAIMRHSLFESLLFALAIAVSLSPQLMPAVVTVALSSGARRLAQRSVIIKRLVCVEDLGNIEVLLTDKTGTLTEGRVAFRQALDVQGAGSDDVLCLGLVCNTASLQGEQVVGGNPIDRALWEAAGGVAARAHAYTVLLQNSFDYDRRIMSTLASDPSGRKLLITKGAPEAVLALCRDVAPAAHSIMDAQFAAGNRLVAVATREAGDASAIVPGIERDLSLAGFIAFYDPPKADAADGIRRLRRLGIDVKIVTGDNSRVAQRVCAMVGLEIDGVVGGSDLDAMDDAALTHVLDRTTIFARVTPAQKSRIVRLQRAGGRTVGFLGDGVNDAVALHDADVGISVDSASDVAKDAADVVMLEKDLGVLADSVMEGRRIFANTIKYVLMGTSSNFGNMLSASGASFFLKFLPALPSQILLNNMLYDAGELTIPSDNVDDELLVRPARWDMALVRRFMLFFGPINAAFDFLTFAVMLFVFHAGAALFQTGLFVENLLTQSLIVFVIRTRRVPFFRSRPGTALLITTIAVTLIGAALPFSPLAPVFGFIPLPWRFFLILVAMIVAYGLLADLGKTLFYRLAVRAAPAPPRPVHARERRIHRVASRWSRHDLSG